MINKIKILGITVITLMSFSLKAQQYQLLNDTNVIFYDYVPDVVITNPLTDTLKIDINQDGLLDVQFYLQYYPATAAIVLPLNNSCKIAFFFASSNDSLSSSDLVWRTGNCYWGSLYNYQNRLAVKITVGNDIYYGWIHVTYSLGPITLTIDKYAFCKIPNYPFLYGQTTTLANNPLLKSNDNFIIRYNNIHSAIKLDSEKLIQTILMTNMLGNVIELQNDINNENAEIAIVNLTQGIYIIKVQFADKTITTRKIILIKN